ncbi:MAG: carbohydrate-binding domain-containing protein [Planctomycetes bacterium]|nr:carbohydrate-binding domain-containing protein [Planctomycetota bacterium]
MEVKGLFLRIVSGIALVAFAVAFVSTLASCDPAVLDMTKIAEESKEGPDVAPAPVDASKVPEEAGEVPSTLRGQLSAAGSPEMLERKKDIRPENEIAELRSEYGRHYLREDGGYVATFSQVPVNYIDSAGEWQTINTTIVADSGGFKNETNSLRSTFPVTGDDAVRIEIAETSDSISVWNENEIRWTSVEGETKLVWSRSTADAEVSGDEISFPSSFAGIDQRFKVYPGRIKHDYVINDLFPQIEGETGNLEFRERVILPEGFYFAVDGLKIVDTRVVTTAVEIRNADDLAVCAFPKPIAHEAILPSEEYTNRDAAMLWLSYRVEPTSDGAYISVLVPVSWLKDENRSFPVAIDPTVSKDVAGNNQDAYQYSAAGYDPAANFLKVGKHDTEAAPYYESGFYFPSVTIAQGTSIDGADFEFTSYSSNYTNTIDTVFYWNDVDNAVDFSGTGISSRTKTSASVTYDSSSSWGADSRWILHPMKGPVQEVVSRGGWSSGNAMVCIWETDSTAGGSYRWISAYERGASYAATMNIYYGGTANRWAGRYSGDWTNDGNWDDWVVPTSTAAVTIPSGCPNYPNISSGTVTVNSLTINSGGSVTVSGGTLTVQNATSSIAISLSGTLTMTSGTINASYVADDIKRLDIKSGGRMDMDGGTLNLTATINDDYSYAMHIESGGTFDMTAGTVNMSNSTTTWWWDLTNDGTLLMSGGTFNIDDELENNGAFTHSGGSMRTGNDSTIADANFNSGCTYTMSGSATLYVGGYLYLSNDCTVTATGGTINMSATGSTSDYIYANDASSYIYNLTIDDAITLSGSYDLDVRGTLTITAGDTLTTSTTPITVKSWTNSASDSAFTYGTGTVTFSGTGAISGSYHCQFNNLTFASGASTTLGLTSGKKVYVYGSFDSVSGSNIAINSGNALDIYSASASSETITFAGDITATDVHDETRDIDVNNTCDIGGSGTIGGDFRVFAGICTLTSNLDIDGDFIINTGATFVMTTHQINVDGSWVYDGSFTRGTGTVVFDGTGNIKGLTTDFHHLTIASTANMTLNPSGGDRLKVHGNFIVSSSGQITVATGETIDIYSSTSDGESIVIDGTISATDVYDGTRDFDTNNDVSMSGSGTINADFRVFSGTTTIASNMNFDGDFVVAATLTMTTHTLSVAGDLDNSGKFIPGASGTVSLDGGGAQSITGKWDGSADDCFRNLTVTGASTAADTSVIVHVLGNVTVETGASLAFTTAGDQTTYLDVEGNITVSGTGTLDVDDAGVNEIVACAGNIDFGASTTIDISEGDSVDYDGGLFLDGGSNTTLTTSGAARDFALHIAKSGPTSSVTLAQNSGFGHVYIDEGKFSIDAYSLALTGGLYVFQGGTLVMTNAAGAISIAGSRTYAPFSFLSGSAEDISAGTITINAADDGTYGAFYAAGGCNFTPAGGKVVFGSTNAQTIRIEEPTNFNFNNIDIGDGTNAHTVSLWNNTSQQTCDIDGNIDIKSACTLGCNGKTLEVAGDWTLSGTFTSGSNIVYFDGAGTGSITGDTTFYRLEIAGGETRGIGGGLTITVSDRLSVYGVLNVTGGTLNANGGDDAGVNNDAPDLSAEFPSIYVSGAGSTLSIASGTISVNVSTMDVCCLFVDSGGTLDMDGGTVTLTNSLSDNYFHAVHVDPGGILDQSGGTLTITSGLGYGATNLGTWNHTDGALDCAGRFQNYGTVNLSGSTTTSLFQVSTNSASADRDFHNGDGSSQAGTFNQSGGTLDARHYVYLNGNGASVYSGTGGQMKGAFRIYCYDEGSALWDLLVSHDLLLFDDANAYDLDVNGDVTIETGMELDSFGTNISASGNWEAQGTGDFVCNTDTVTFDGSAAQIITSGTTNPFYNLTIVNTHASPDDTNDVQTQDAVSVTGTLTVTDGQFSPGNGSSFADISVGANGIWKCDADSAIAISGDVTLYGDFLVYANGVDAPSLTMANAKKITVNDGGMLDLTGTSTSNMPVLYASSGTWDIDFNVPSPTVPCWNFQYCQIESCTVNIIGVPFPMAWEYVYFDYHPGSGECYIDFTQSTAPTSVWIPLWDTFFGNTTNVSNARNIKADAGTTNITIYGEDTGTIGGEAYDDDPSGCIHWYREKPAVMNEDTGEIFDGDTALSDALEDPDTTDGHTLTQINSVPLWGDHNVDYNSLPANVVLNRLTIYGSIDFPDAATYTLQNSFVLGNVGASDPCANVYHCSVDGTIDATTAKWNIATGAITAGTKTENLESVTAADYFGGNYDRNDLHLDLGAASVANAIEGATTSAVGFDYDNQPRGSPATIGADEIDDDTSNIGQILWSRTDLTVADSIGPVNAYRWDSSGTGLVWLTTGALDSATPRWQNALVAIDPSDGSVIAGVRGTLSSATDNNVSGQTYSFTSAWEFSGPVEKINIWTQRDGGGSDYLYDIFIVFDNDNDGRSDSVAKIAVPYAKSGGLSASSLRFDETTLEWSYTVSEGPVSHLTFNVQGNYDVCFMAESHSGGAWSNSNPVAIMIDNDPASGGYGTAKNYHQQASAPHYDYRFGLSQFVVGEFIAVLKSNAAGDADVVKLDNTLTPTASLNVTGGGNTLNGTNLTPMPGPYANPGRIWMTSDDVDHFFLVESNLSDVVSPFDAFDLSAEAIAEGASATFVYPMRSYYSAPHVFAAYRENGHTYAMKVKDDGTVDPDWIYDTPTPARDSQQIWGDLVSGGMLYNRLTGYLWMIGASGDLICLTCPNVSTVATPDGAARAGYPLRIADASVSKATFIFTGSNQSAILFLDSGEIAAVRTE